MHPKKFRLPSQRWWRRQLEPAICQLTTDRTGLAVSASPAEATAVGNFVAQTAASGISEASSTAQRVFVAGNVAVETY